tara:strand:- start:435 stop:1004 length:570 start_codon:yes stop_codon:yes gene_type:complete
MSSVHSYTFDSLSRIGDDVCGVSEREMQNENFSSYSVQSYFAKNCGMASSINFATSQPNIFYKGSHQCGLGGCNIDTSSKLLIGSIQTNPKCRISLQERPFLTVPFLGRGPSMPVKESQLLQGEYNGDKKSCKTIMEKSIRPNQDLVPALKASIQNPANLCEGIAADGWIRGGLPSRELSRDQDYFNKQ